MHESYKIPAYHQICLEIRRHSHNACTRLTEIFPPALQGVIENAILVVIMYLTRLCESYRNIFNNEHLFTCKICAQCRTFISTILLPAGAIIA